MCKKKVNTTYKKATCMLLALTMICSLFIFDFGRSEDAVIAEALSLPDDIESKISDLDTSNFAFSNAVIPGSTDITFINTPDNNGRIWTDKSVNWDQAFIYDVNGGVVNTVQAPDDGFLVTLSALSQGIAVEDIIVEPSDTVFVIDVSGSMVTNNVPGTSPAQTRIQVVIAALNDAIKRLMEVDVNNRISVVIYGGQAINSQNHARAYRILELGRYDARTPIFTVSGSNVTVRSNANDSTYGTPPPLRTSFTVEGGTPTQLGIRIGAQVLRDVPVGLVPGGTMINITTPGGVTVPVTRKPNIILMTDGEPTLGWYNYRLDTAEYEGFGSTSGATGTTYTYEAGNGSAGDMGLTALTVMTAAYEKQRVRDRYYGTNAAYSSRSVGFYTLGLGVNSLISNAMLDPYGKSGGGRPNAQLVVQDNRVMLDVLNEFAPGSVSVTFPVIRKGQTMRDPQTVTNTLTGGISPGFVLTCNYDTLSFTAMDKDGLDEAFNQITQQIVTQGNYSTSTGDNPKYDGYLVFSDVIGEYMQFGSFNGIWYKNRNYNAGTFDSVTTAPGSANWNLFIENIEKHLDFTPGTTAEDLVNANITAGNLNAGVNSKTVYYANFDRTYFNSLDSFGALIDDATAIGLGAAAKVELYTVQALADNALTGDPSNLMYIVFQVVTALRAGDFENYFSSERYLVSVLQQWDQIIRWYIPADLIPLRSVKVVEGMLQVTEAVPIRAIYTVTPNVTKISAGLTAAYSNANKAPGDNLNYYFYTNRWRGTDGRVVTAAPRNDPANMTQAFFVPSEQNTFYKGDLSRATVLKEPNVKGPTGTSPWCWEYRHFTGEDNATGEVNTVVVQGLGNNGRIELPVETLVEIRKTFNFDDATGLDYENLGPPNKKIASISFTIVGMEDTTARTEIFRKTVFLDDFVDEVDTLGYYVYKLSIPPGLYSVIESGGTATGYTHIRPALVTGRYPNPIDPILFNYILLENTYDDSPVDPGLYLYKEFHGLRPGELPANFSITIREINTNLTYGPYTQQHFLDASPPGRIYIEDFPAGEYRIEETVDSVPGFVLTVTPETFTVTEDQENEVIMIVVDNVYNPPDLSLILDKTVVPDPIIDSGVDDLGNPVDVIREPVDLVFKIEGISPRPDPPPSPPSPYPPDYPGNLGYIRTIHWGDLDAVNHSITIYDIPPGKYTITELGGDLPGYNGPSISLTMNDGANVVNLQNGGEFELLPDADHTLRFSFVNTYSLPPPPRPPRPRPPTSTPPEETPPPGQTPPIQSPQTGDGRSVIVPIIALSFGVLCITGAEFYRRRSGRSRNS